MDNENVYAPPASNLEKPTVESPLASRWARLGGALIDGVLAILITFPLMYLTGYWEKAMAQEVGFADNLLMGVLGLVIFLLLHGYLLVNYGQTIGKKVIGTRIVSVDSNEILPLSKIFFLRYLPISVAAQIPGIGQLLVIVDDLFIFRGDKRCVHDLIAGTKVVKANTD